MQNKLRQMKRISLCVLCLVMIASLAYAEKALQINVANVTENITLLWDMGNGNTAILHGEDGVFMIDTKGQELADQLITKIAKISDKPIRLVVNTHWHFDHVGGNEKLANTGAMIIAHENVRARMRADQRMDMFNVTVPPAPKVALPMMTFTKDLTLSINGEEVHVFHLGAGHTDGDAIVRFRNANVIHLGDLYFNGFYPYIGIEAGGSINSMIQVGKTVLDMIDDATTIIPGHGPLAQKTEYAEYVKMLIDIRDAIHPQIVAGKSLEEVIASKPTQAFDAKWGAGLFTPDQFTKLVYTDLSQQ